MPEPLTPAERLARAVQFWRQVLPGLVGYGTLLAELQVRPAPLASYRVLRCMTLRMFVVACCSWLSVFFIVSKNLV